MAHLPHLLLLITLVLPSRGDADKPEPVHEGKPLHKWIADLQYPNPDVRYWAALALEKMGPKAKPALLELTKVSLDGNEDERVRRFSILALGAIGPEAKAAVPLLALMLPDKDYGNSAAYALGNIGEPALQPLLDALTGENDEASLNATLGLGKMGPKAKDAVVPLMARLNDSNVTRRYATARVLGKIGPEARAAEKPLRALLKDKDAGVRVSATLALARINREYVPTAVADLTAVVKDKQSKVREFSASALGEIGPAAKAAVPALIDLLHDFHDKPVDRDWVIRALGRIGPAAKAAVPDLIVLLKGDHPYTALVAAEALGQIGPEAKAAVPALQAIIKQDPDCSKEFIEALRKIDPKAAPRDRIP